MSGADTDTIETIAYYRSDLPEKFGVPRQSGLAPNLKGRIVFEEKYSDPNALTDLRDLTGYGSSGDLMSKRMTRSVQR